MAIGFIFARGGSKGLPGKNIKIFNGKPLIAWSIEQAIKAKGIDEIYVSTDSEEIAAISRNYGAKISFMRPANLATDTSPEWDSWRHALRKLESQFGYLPKEMVSIPATSPLRTSGDIEACLDKFKSGIYDGVITITESNRNPYFNMVSVGEGGVITLASKVEANINRRQDAPRLFDVTTVCYVFKSKYILESSNIFNGKVSSVVIPKLRAIDIDDEIDFKIAEFISTMGEQNGAF